MTDRARVVAGELSRRRGGLRRRLGRRRPAGGMHLDRQPGRQQAGDDGDHNWHRSPDARSFV
jgi:hypothetical protein